MPRRHDIDALRAIAFSLLIAYHLAMLYVFGWGWHLKSNYLSEFLQVPMLFVNRWRMDLIFLISGVSAAIMLAKAAPGSFLRERSGRLLIPLLFGVLVVVPVQPYCQGVANGLVEPGFWQFLGRYYTGYAWPPKAFDGWQTGFTWNHLWYLVYLWCYTALLVVLQKPLQSGLGQGLRNAFTHLHGWRLLVWPFAPLLVITVTLQLKYPNNNALFNDWYAHAIYFTVFMYGYWLGINKALWAELARLRKEATALALMSYFLYALSRVVFEDEDPPVTYLIVWIFRNLYIWAALCAILGWGHTLLNRPFRWLPWATQAVYPWYILHQSLIVLLAYWLVPLKLGPFAEPLLVGLGTLAGCWLLTSLLVSRIGWLRVCFGMKRSRTQASDDAKVAQRRVHQ